MAPNASTRRFGLSPIQLLISQVYTGKKLPMRNLARSSSQVCEFTVARPFKLTEMPKAHFRRLALNPMAHLAV